VARLATRLAPHDLLDRLQQVEQAHGRTRGERWGARTLDLDLLLYGALELCDARLVIPHPGLSSRDFVLYPLAEIAPPELVVPGLGRLEELLEQCPRRYLIEAG
jgi:2-amino-4-hydroxy-6-hydroxymethyldihydropteridine diphosphokinase